MFITCGSAKRNILFHRFTVKNIIPNEKPMQIGDDELW
jgi:hypothetical protein